MAKAAALVTVGGLGLLAALDPPFSAAESKGESERPSGGDSAGPLTSGDVGASPAAADPSPAAGR